LLVLTAAAGACERPDRLLRVATTTSVENSGLLATLLPQFEREAGTRVQAVAVGSGRALDILERRDADVVLTHDPDAERRAVDRGILAGYRKVMFNNFLIAGPPADPADLRDASSAADAMARIAGSGRAFASRADSSGTHARELLLWRLAGRAPSGARLIETGQGMEATLRIASERQCYVLTDRATFTQLRPTLHLVPLYAGDAALINTYGAGYREGLAGDRVVRARGWLDWLSDGRGRAAISAFAVRGTRVFTVWPPDRPRSRPEDLPDGR
jgi:tungstate transport system substrate-binding protein